MTKQDAIDRFIAACDDDINSYARMMTVSHQYNRKEFDKMQNFIMAVIESYCYFDDKFQGNNINITVKIEPE
jgi:hypothetical protein